MKRAASLMMGLLFLALVRPPMASTTTSEIRGLVIDPQGAVVEGATVTLIDEASGRVRTVLTDAKGEFAFTDVAPGRYQLSVARSGFRTEVRRGLRLNQGQRLQIEVKLQVAPTIERVEVSESPPIDPVYAQLRDMEPSGEALVVENEELKRDAGQFQFHRGTFYFFTPVLDRVTGAIFVGEGRFLMRPPTEIERRHLRHFLGETEDPTQVSEPFDQLILYFTDDTYRELKAKGAVEKKTVPEAVRAAFKNHQRELRRELRQTIELRLLADLYNPVRSPADNHSDYPGQFTAFIKGRKHKKLIFGTDPLGFAPSLPSPEEVGLFSYERSTRGIWSLFHYEQEYVRGTASSSEDHREYDILHYRIEAVIDRGEHLTASAQVTFRPRMPGLRVIQFALFPRLRVSRVLDETGAVLPFIQADWEEGGAFAVITPQPLDERPTTMTIEYRGPEAVRDSGGGNYILIPRSTWYPNNWQTSFGDRATFDMTFRIPRNLRLVATGRQVRQWEEGKYAVSQWISDSPLAVAGFNYGDFRVLTEKDKDFLIEVFTNKQEPDELKRVRHLAEQAEQQGISIDVPLGNLSTAGLARRALAEAISSVRIFNHYFSPDPYGRLVMSQQPAGFFGQSWPMLVYMPYTAFLDATQRLALGLPMQFSKFTDVVGPHEIAHQWWGHLVGWKTYHDQWLSEGFAEFSASLYLEFAYHKDRRKRYKRWLKFWEEERRRILEKVPLGIGRRVRRPNDIGPIWLGSRLNSAPTAGAYFYLIYRKGAFILHMLRMMMRDYQAKPGHQDDRFIQMMRDFVQSHIHGSASTEDFKRIVEKYMTPEMDLDGNGRMDWFFDEWVYGTDLPHYRLEYSFGTASGGKTLLRLNITQSGVSPNFKMLVPIYLDFGKDRIARLGVATITGNSSTGSDIPLPTRPKAVKLCANYDVLCTIEEVKTK